MTKDKDNLTGDILARHTALQDRDVLEIGCGEGRMTRPLSTLAKTLTALDPDPEAVRIVGRSLGNQVALHCLTAEALPFPDASFDTVVFSQSLHHVADITRAFAQARRLLRPRGEILVIEPDPDSELMRVFRIFDEEETTRLARVRSFLQGITGGRRRTLVFEPVWEFADCEELLAWGETFVASGASRRQAVLAALGPKAADRPLHLRDRLTLLHLQEIGAEPTAAGG